MSEESKPRPTQKRKGVKASRPGSPSPAPKDEPVVPSPEVMEKLAEVKTAEAVTTEPSVDPALEAAREVTAEAEAAAPLEPLETRLARLAREQAAERDRLVEEERLRLQAERKAEAEAQMARMAAKADKVLPTTLRLTETLEELEQLSMATGPVQLPEDEMRRLRRAVRSLRGTSRRLRWSLRF